jgi:hypothetical protein
MVKEETGLTCVFPSRRIQKCDEDILFMDSLKVFHLLPLSIERFGAENVVA